MPKQEPYNEPALEYLFHPNSIAIVGVSSDLTKPSAGQRFIQMLVNAGYKGKIYPVGRKGGEIFGLRIYPSIKDVPDSIDYAILAIPATYTPELVSECATVGVKTIHMFTAGFSEIGDEEGKELESQIATIARQKGIHIVGPNCWGLYCPKTGLTFHGDFPKESGPVGFMAQSGGNSIQAVLEAAMRGACFSKVISYGNACDLNESDFLEYLTDDCETKIIALYIEGIRDGGRFMEVLKRAAKIKPVVIYKGGMTEGGVRAVASHTGAVAGSNRIWNSLLRQVGAIQVYSIEELIDMVLLFMHMSPPKGKRVAVIGVGGGASVLAADTCSDAGLVLPPLPAEIRWRLRDIYTSEAGGSFKNPVDILSGGRTDLVQKTISMIANWDQIDLLMIHIPFDVYAMPGVREGSLHVQSIINLAKEINNRAVVVLRRITSTEGYQAASEAQVALYQAGFPVYPSINRAANAISKFVQYYHNKSTRLGRWGFSTAVELVMGQRRRL
jgi:acyl-CoA synthetase (NDP forming)